MSPEAAAALPEVFGTVGTDHHPFRRLSEWLDGWLADGGAERAVCFVQHGTAQAPRLAAGEPLIAFSEMMERMQRAAVIVCHGAGATIMQARQAGKTPIVLPRLAANREHVDDHQLIFARRLAAEGKIALAATEEEFRELLDDALRGIGPASSAPTPDGDDGVAATVRRFEVLIADLMAGVGRERGVEA